MAVNARLLAHVLFLRAIWRQRDRWDAARIVSHRSHALARVRAETYARSAFYRRHHAGLLHAPLEALPPVTKSDLMEHFDEAVTVPGLQRTDLEAHLTPLAGGDGNPGGALAGTVVGYGHGRDHRHPRSVRVGPHRVGHGAGLLRQGHHLGGDPGGADQAIAHGRGQFPGAHSPVGGGGGLDAVPAGANPAPGRRQPPVRDRDRAQRLSTAPAGGLSLRAGTPGC